MSTDAADLPQLTDRQEKILALVVREYTASPEPVGSKLIADRHFPQLSSATIRNDLAALEDLGMVTSPHTSAGRIPTERGYRYFVKRLLEAQELSDEEKTRIREVFHESGRDVDSWMQAAATTLARTTRSAALVTAPRAYQRQFKHLALINVQGNIVMMVLVMHGGSMRQQVLTLQEPLSQSALTVLTSRLNELCDGKTADGLRAIARAADSELEREILTLTAESMDDAEAVQSAPIHDGFAELLPDLSNHAAVMQAARIMEERALLTDIVRGTLQTTLQNDPPGNDVSILIGGENRWHEINNLSMVLTKYGVNGQAEGALIAFGPTRMQYGRAISAVRFIAGMMTDMLVGYYGRMPTPPASSEE